MSTSILKAMPGKLDNKILSPRILSLYIYIYTPWRRQSKTLSTVDERRSIIDRNSVFDCHLSPMWQQTAIENSVSNDFWSTFFDSIGVFDCRLPGVIYRPSFPVELTIRLKRLEPGLIFPQNTAIYFFFSIKMYNIAISLVQRICFVARFDRIYGGTLDVLYQRFHEWADNLLNQYIPLNEWYRSPVLFKAFGNVKNIKPVQNFVYCNFHCGSL